jgi:hypothetical protein
MHHSQCKTPLLRVIHITLIKAQKCNKVIRELLMMG